MQENITDLLTPEGVKKIKVGELLIFKGKDGLTKLKIISKKKGQVMAEKVFTVEGKAGFSHYGHNLLSDKKTLAKYNAPYCEDCQVAISKVANLKGSMISSRRSEKELRNND